MYYTEYGAETKLNSMVDSLPDCYSRADADKLSTLRMTHILLQTILELEFRIPSMFGSTHVVHNFFFFLKQRLVRSSSQLHFIQLLLVLICGNTSWVDFTFYRFAPNKLLFR